jgi:hypothetical protein
MLPQSVSEQIFSQYSILKQLCAGSNFETVKAGCEKAGDLQQNR